MKIIGLTESSGLYIATVSKTEIEKVFNLYYGKMKKEIRVGDELALGAGYDFRSDIHGACEKMTNAMVSFESARETMMKFSVMVAQLPGDQDGK